MSNKEKLLRIARMIINNSLSEEERIASIQNIILIKNSQPKPKAYKYDLSQIAEQVCEYSGLSIEQLNRETTSHEVVIWRQMAHFKAWKNTKSSLAEIGRYFGNLNHATVLHSKKVIQDYLR